MEISVSSILLGLGGKSLLNWTLVLLQRKHLFWSFLGVFCFSLALVDSLLTLCLSVLYLQGDGNFLGMRLTRHHVCLLVQIFSYIYDVLNWPVLIMTGLDQYWNLLPGSLPALRLQKLSYIAATSVLWILVLLYVFLVSEFYPVLGSEPPELLHQCWVLTSSQIPQVATMLFLTIACAMLHVHIELPMPSCRGSRQIKTVEPSRKDIIGQSLWIFLSTWAFFIVFLAVCLVLPVGIPVFMGFNIAWVCFIHSFLVGVVVCTRWVVPPLTESPAITDYFCDWRLFSQTDQGNT